MAMGIIQGTVSIAANTTVNDILVNEMLAFNRDGASIVDWGVLAAATGIKFTLNAGTRLLCPEFAPNVIAASQFPLFPDHFLNRFGLLAQERLLLKGQNTTGGAIVVGWQFRLANVPSR